MSQSTKNHPNESKPSPLTKRDEENRQSFTGKPKFQPPTNEELAEYREIFNLVDRDGSGSISMEEFKQLMDALGIRTSSEELESIITEIDADCSGEIDFTEFVAVMSRRATPDYSSVEIIRAFKVFETGDLPSGFVKIDDLMEALTTYGQNTLSEKRARELLTQLDQDRSGVVRYKEFINMIMS